MHRQISAISIDRICGGGHRAVPGEELEGLMRSIRRLGLLMPLLVRPRGEGYELIAGARRLAACRALGMDEVECIVMPALEEECLLAALAENACRAAPPAADTEALRRALHERHGYTRAELDELCPAEGAADGVSRAGGAAVALDGLDMPGCAAATAERDMPDGAAATDELSRVGSTAAMPEVSNSPGDARAPQGCGEEPPCALPGEGAEADRAKARPARRDTHGYIRDERLIVNAMANVVDELKRAGVEARMDVSEAEDRVNVHVSCPRISALKCRHAPPVKGEHSVEFLKNIGESAEKCALQIEKHGDVDIESGLALSEIGRALREKGAGKSCENAADGGASAREMPDAAPRAAQGDLCDMRYFPRRAAQRGVVQERSCAWDGALGAAVRAEDAPSRRGKGAALEQFGATNAASRAAAQAEDAPPRRDQGAVNVTSCASTPMEEVAPRRGRGVALEQFGAAKGEPRASVQTDATPPRRDQGAAHEQFCATNAASRAAAPMEEVAPRRGRDPVVHEQPHSSVQADAALPRLDQIAANVTSCASTQAENALPQRGQVAAHEQSCTVDGLHSASAQSDAAPPRRDPIAAEHEHTRAPATPPRASSHTQGTPAQPRPRAACAPDDPPARVPMSAAEYVEHMLREEQARIRRSHILT
ncbi:MAG: ParB/RepB/Spo0J family partition protein [Candidatus Fimadaptatus sp.]